MYYFIMPRDPQLNTHPLTSPFIAMAEECGAPDDSLVRRRRRARLIFVALIHVLLGTNTHISTIYVDNSKLVERVLVVTVHRHESTSIRVSSPEGPFKLVCIGMPRNAMTSLCRSIVFNYEQYIRGRPTSPTYL